MNNKTVLHEESLCGLLVLPWKKIISNMSKRFFLLDLCYRHTSEGFSLCGLPVLRWNKSFPICLNTTKRFFFQIYATVIQVKVLVSQECDSCFEFS